jgi:predicted P-loop ATPase
MNYFVIPNKHEVETSKVYFSKTDLRTWVNELETMFGLLPDTMQRRNTTTDKPIKAWRGVDIALLRKAIVFHVYENGYIPVRDFGSVINIDYSSVIVARQKAKDYLDNNDAKFLEYLTKVNSKPVLDFISILTTLKKAG